MRGSGLNTYRGTSLISNRQSTRVPLYLGGGALEVGQALLEPRHLWGVQGSESLILSHHFRRKVACEFNE